MSTYPDTPGFVRYSDTSMAAADSMLTDAPTLRDNILAFIRREGDATCDEVEVRCNLTHQTASARIRELVLQGKLVDTGDRRKTRSGRKARVYEAAEAA
ncbi:MarR family transcriptional regulator [Bradyrhizobium sp. BRP05]|nr:MarR family transcriptional regulator [Bradyrhizobium sp. BRP05]